MRPGPPPPEMPVWVVALHILVGCSATALASLNSCLAKHPPATSLRFGNSGSAFCCPGSGRQSAVESAAPLSRHHPHDARGSGSGLGAAPRSEFAFQRQPSVRQAALEHPAAPTPFSTGYFRACASGSRAADNSIHQLSLVISPLRSQNHVRPHNARPRAHARTGVKIRPERQSAM